MEKKIKHEILIVDDSPLIIERLKDMLEESENVNAILEAENFEQAREIVTGKKPTVVVLDISLPDKNGIELLQFIKRNYPQTAVIMLTNQVNNHYKKLCLKSGATAFLDKTKDFEQVVGIIAEL